jgi:hypothetical protein
MALPDSNLFAGPPAEDDAGLAPFNTVSDGLVLDYLGHGWFKLTQCNSSEAPLGHGTRLLRVTNPLTDLKRQDFGATVRVTNLTLKSCTVSRPGEPGHGPAFLRHHFGVNRKVKNQSSSNTPTPSAHQRIRCSGTFPALGKRYQAPEE